MNPDKTCYTCDLFTHKDGKTPWCMDANEETNALSPLCVERKEKE
jgi:hypothetical protein